MRKTGCVAVCATLLAATTARPQIPATPRTALEKADEE
jgi:hypothetical protein